MSRRFHSAFTLAEVLLAIALIALLSGLIAGAGMLDTDSLATRPPDRVLMSALKRARLESINRGREVTLAYDLRGFFSITDTETATPLATMYLSLTLEKAVAEAQKRGEDVEWDKFPNDVGVIFEAIQPELIRKGGAQFGEPQIKEIRFYPDSTMTPVKISVHVGDSDFASFEIDPFCAAPKGEENER